MPDLQALHALRSELIALIETRLREHEVRQENTLHALRGVLDELTGIVTSLRLQQAGHDSERKTVGRVFQITMALAGLAFAFAQVYPILFPVANVGSTLIK